MRHFNKLLTAIILTALVTACNDDFLDKQPETSIGKENFFNNEADLDMFIYNLYNYPSTGIYQADAATDNAATTGVTELKTMMMSDPTPSTITGGWSWGGLRDANFFLENFRKAKLSEARLNHYEGLGRYFRARFYVDKIKRYSDVPWYDKVIATNDNDLLFKARDPRTTVVDKIMEDFQFAIDHVDADSEKGEVNSWVIKTEFARFALYEGTYRRYHPELQLAGTANDFLTKARDVAKDIIDNGGFSIYDTGHPNQDYATLFYSADLSENPEVIFGRYFIDDVLNGNSGTDMFGNYEYNPVKDLVQAYLMADGSYYSSQSNYQTNSFLQEFANRDPRLSQSYAHPGWTLIYTDTYSQGGGLYVQQLAKNFSGYHQIKGFYNTKELDERNGIDVPLYRYAEVLLTYAEARAELQELTQADLDITINKLRDRVDMPHLFMGPAVDPTQEAKYPAMASSQKAELLEIRRERRVELAFEGYRYDDLMRWGAGKVFSQEPEGIYFSGLGNHDLNGDGEPDIKLIPSTETIPDVKETNGLGETLRYYRVGTFGQDVSVFLKNGNSGTVQIVQDLGTFVDPKYYYRPVPQAEVTLNPNLKQIFGW